MQKKKTIILFSLSVLFFSLSLVGTYVYAEKPPFGHSWSEMECDTKMCVGDNVGIGTTSPSGKLHIVKEVGDSNARGFIEFSPSTGNAHLRMGLNSDYAWIQSHGSKPLRVNELGNDVILNASGGNVGIGTTSPGAKLDVSGNVNISLADTSLSFGSDTRQMLNLWSTSYGIGIQSYTQYYRSAKNFAWYKGGSHNDSELNAGTGGTIQMQLTNGNLGISGGLTTAGTIYTTGGTVKIRKSDDSDDGNLQAKIIYSSTFMNGAATPNVTGAGVGDLLFIADTSTGNDFYFRGNLGGDTGRIHVNTLFKTTSSFLIDHPTKEGFKLIHSGIEGPENAVYYRGEARLKNGKAIVKLPDYFESLTRKNGRTVLLTCKDNWTPLWVSGGVKNGEFIVKTTEWGNKNQEFYWEVKAVRADVEPLKVERKASEFK